MLLTPCVARIATRKPGERASYNRGNFALMTYYGRALVCVAIGCLLAFLVKAEENSLENIWTIAIISH